MNKKDAKNLIIISIDDLRADAIGCNPDGALSGLKARALDDLARRGVFFNNCVTTAPYTTNAHASILTGLWPYNHGLIDFFRSPLMAPTIFEILKKNKFKTLWQTDFPFLLGESLGFTQGIDKFVSKKEAVSLAWLKKNQGERLACFFHFANVHEPFGFVGNDFDREDWRKKTEELLRKNNLESDGKAWRGQHFVIDEASDEDLILRQNYKKVLRKLCEEKKYDEIMKLYVEGVNYFDEKRFKPFLEKIKKLGIWENSLIVIVGDHGEAWDEHNEGHYQGDGRNSLADEIVKVPLIILNSGKKAEINKKLVRTIDIVPSCLKNLNIENQINFDGVNVFFDSGERLAFSQYWQADSAQITILMNEVFSRGELETPKFASKLIASAVWQGQNKFSRTENGESGCKRLKPLLEEYDRKTFCRFKKQLIEIEKKDREKISQELRAIGYNV